MIPATIPQPPSAASPRIDREAVRRHYAERVRQSGVRATAAESGLSRAAVTSILAGVARDGTYALGAIAMTTTPRVDP